MLVVVDLLVDLRLGVSDGHLEVPVSIVAPFVEERIHFLGPVQVNLPFLEFLDFWNYVFFFRKQLRLVPFEVLLDNFELC